MLTGLTLQITAEAAQRTAVEHISLSNTAVTTLAVTAPRADTICPLSAPAKVPPLAIM